MPNTHSALNIVDITVQDEQLELMGLNKDAIEQAIKDGLIQFKRTTPLHPLTHGGSTAWGEIVFALRGKLITMSNEWSYYQKGGLSITHNKETGVALVVTSGDKETGLAHGQPSTKNKKGPSTRSIVSCNQTQDMFDEPVNNFENTITLPIDTTQTWVLLYHFDKAIKEIRFELSLPSSTAKISGKDDKLKIDSWKTRILFEPMPFDMNSNIEPMENITFSDDISFNVSKKA